MRASCSVRPLIAAWQPIQVYRHEKAASGLSFSKTFFENIAFHLPSTSHPISPQATKLPLPISCLSALAELSAFTSARFGGGAASDEPENGFCTECPGGAPAGAGGTGNSDERVLLGVADDPEGCDAKLLEDVTELDWTRFHLFDGAGGSVGIGVESEDPVTPDGAAYVDWSPTGKGARAPAFDVVACILDDAIFAKQAMTLRSQGDAAKPKLQTQVD